MFASARFEHSVPVDTVNTSNYGENVRNRHTDQNFSHLVEKDKTFSSKKTKLSKLTRNKIHELRLFGSFLQYYEQ